MSDTEPISSGWACPACQRRVPGKIDRCRCGAERAAASPSPETSGPAPVQHRGWGRALAEAGLLCSIVTAVAYYYVTAPRPSAAERTHPMSTASDARPIVRETVLRAKAATDRPPDPAPAAVTRESSGDLPEPSAKPLEDLIEHAMPSVVLVEAVRTRGSGFFVRSDLVVTNAHVIAGASQVNVTTQNGARVTGTVVESSTDLDLALVSVPSFDARLPLGASSALKLGQGIVALGWAEDLTQSTVTRGIVTGLRHDGKQRLVQTDAVPNHGDSGGPLLDRHGEVVGVTTFRADVSGKTSGFAVAIDDVKAFLAAAHR